MASEFQTVRRNRAVQVHAPSGKFQPSGVSWCGQRRRFTRRSAGGRLRLLQNVDDPARFIHEIEYETHEAVELNRQRIASDPRVQVYSANLARAVARLRRDRRLSGSGIGHSERPCVPGAWRRERFHARFNGAMAHLRGGVMRCRPAAAKQTARLSRSRSSRGPCPSKLKERACERGALPCIRDTRHTLPSSYNSTELSS